LCHSALLHRAHRKTVARGRGKGREGNEKEGQSGASFPLPRKGADTGANQKPDSKGLQAIINHLTIYYIIKTQV
jgi:hypothetical protein